LSLFDFYRKKKQLCRRIFFNSSPFSSRKLKFETINDEKRMISLLQLRHSSISGLRLRLEPSTGQGLSNKPEYVKIDRLEPEF
jgi:hypothetical protein